MKSTVFSSLGRKIAFAVTVVLLVAGGTFVYFAQRTGYTMLEQNAQVKAHGIAELMNGIVEHAMLERQTDHLRHALSEAAAAPSVLNAYILGADGAVHFRARPDVGADSTKLPLERFSVIPGMEGEKFYSTREGGSLIEYIVTPIVKRAACFQCHTEQERTMGYFGMRIGVDDLRALASQHRMTNIVMTVAIFLGLGVFIFLALSFLVIKPVGTLHAHIRKIEGGLSRMKAWDATEFPVLEEPKKNDEIADLSRDFNNLVRRLNDAHAKIHDMHQGELEQADRLASTGRMAAGMAHEIKNPIAGVFGALQVFDGEMDATDPRKEIVAEMMVQLERVNHAVNDLLSYARPTPPVLDEVRVDEVIRKTASLLSQQVKGKAISISTGTIDPMPTVYADRKQLQQVIWNIMLNAVQSIETAGSVAVTAERDDASVAITISDTGKGIPESEMAKVFTPFFTTKHKGTGLGMTICRRIVEQHGGTIAIASTLGSGTRVTIHLPVRKQA